mgnify:CR=1 FL=1
MTVMTEILLQGLLLGGLYALFALGQSLMFGVMRLTNTAQGDFIILGGFFAISLVGATGLSPGLAFGLMAPLAFVFGSMAKQQDTAASDVDLLVVSDTLGYGDVFGALEAASQTLGRTINPALYTVADFKARQLGDNAFINRVMQQPKIWLIGQEESPKHEPTHPT